MNDDTALMDIESIKQLKARYCRYLDTKDWDRWRDLFTDDFVGDTTEAGGSLIVGVDEFMAYTRNTIGKPSQATVHQVHAPEIELTSPRDCEPPRRRSRVALPTKTPNRGPPRRVTTPVCPSSTSCDVNTCPHERCRGYRRGSSACSAMLRR